MEHVQGIRELTGRELEVLGCLVEGMSRTEIGLLLHVSPNTVRTHVQSILHKLKVHSALAAVAIARRAGVTGASIPVDWPAPPGVPLATAAGARQRRARPTASLARPGGAPGSLAVGREPVSMRRANQSIRPALPRTSVVAPPTRHSSPSSQQLEVRRVAPHPQPRDRIVDEAVHQLGSTSAKVNPSSRSTWW